MTAVDRGVRLIVIYKASKAVTQLVLAVVLLVALGGLRQQLSLLAAHLASVWAQRLVEWLMQNLTDSRVHLAAVALGADAALSAFEGWALHRHEPWGEWLVVVATGTPVPFEVYALFAHPHPLRLLILAINVTVVGYLARRRLSGS